MNHDELAADLAGHLRGERVMVWTDLQLGPAGSPRPDVYAIDKSYVAPCPRAFEVKVSLSDFRADVTAGKWSSYLKFAGSVTFAVPDGLVTKAAVPEACGLIVRTETGWRSRKKPVWQRVDIPVHTWLKLLIDGVEREGPAQRRRVATCDPYSGSDGFARRYGKEAARWVASALTVQRDVEYAQERATQMIERAELDAKRIRLAAENDIEPAWRELRSVLGLGPAASPWEVKAAIRKVREEAEGKAERELIRWFVERAKSLIPEGQ